MPDDFESFEANSFDDSSEPVVSEGFEGDDSSFPAGSDDLLPSEDEVLLPVEEDPPLAEAPLPVEDESPPPAEEAPSPVEDESLPPAEEAPLPVEDASLPPVEEDLPPAEGDDQISSGGGSGGSAVDLDSALGSLTAFLDTRERLSNPELELAGIETFALSPITSSSGLKGVLLEIIGPYDNIVTQYRYQQNTSSNYTYVNEVTPDYPWIASALLFIVLLLSLFRFLGRCFSWMK